MISQTLDLHYIAVTEGDSFQCRDEGVLSMEAINEDTWFVGDIELEFIERITIKNNKEQFKMNVNGIWIIDNGVMYATDFKNRSILRLSPLGSASTVFSTAPLRPVGICQST